MPLGYPAQNDTDPWSPFFAAPDRTETNQQQFLSIIQQLAEAEQLATAVSGAKVLDLPERAEYLSGHPVMIYGAVVTGPVSELKKLAQTSTVRAVKVKETRLWNWHS
ncbi:anti sigma factor C-terminal domain-containing protein [Paenibacillus donghaensis]|uniref:anti sigma factor C-terminal domain-containing protein n=1 Tax=Paenibacillus donghaensis TaxID=414771 RepID=UPI001B8050FF|nr:anti sigma factor C-terminal domain-containing protein [Paenibacillus donghaensis]